MLPGDTTSERKTRGAFFTPATVARFIADWAIHSPSDAVLEPSCGEAVFLHEAGRAGRHKGRLLGVELHSASAAEAERTLRAQGIEATIEAGDFFLREPTGNFDAVIGNPPYVRYQDFSGDSRARSRAAALRAGVSLTGLASSWAAFTVHSALNLKPGGRLGLVLPAELLTVNYAASVRQYLMDHFKSVGLVLFIDRVFPGVSEEVVLLLADGFDPSGVNGTDHCDIFQVQDAKALNDFAVGRKWAPRSRGGKWSASLVPPPALEAYTAATMAPGFDVLESWGDTTLGMVTGNNKFFTLTSERVTELGLTTDDLISLSPPGSRHLRSLTLTARMMDELAAAGSATWLFRPSTPSAAALRYIAMGEKTGVDTAYKCRVRKPWWLVPYQQPADLLLTYMNADTPRLCTNRVRTHHLNSVHGVYLRSEVRKTGVDLLPLASLNSVTLLGAETVGRAYGGGVLKVEPREADQLPMPAPALVESRRKELSALRGRVGASLRQGRLLEAVRAVDEVVLVDALGMSGRQLSAVRAAHAEMAARRSARGKDARSDD
ncbi:SAM-dependent DNA methyltransferase [Kribbella sandramycini]|uniref:Adenine-specific DNA methylase n=1 Tax=Kribbella sandramycini TaxID=60450 RepID=A0A7Y4P063_9ACTN|nr:N-6 DNA methylase [Kribbella sandramycini]MBB6564617.1 adenine-specific DNA methylase [Kribbella sandramycini]NOL42321.1 SAM-dependent DNA methyltransferase [Kribbella sandramycini]